MRYENLKRIDYLYKCFRIFTNRSAVFSVSGYSGREEVV